MLCLHSANYTLHLLVKALHSSLSTLSYTAPRYFTKHQCIPGSHAICHGTDNVTRLPSTDWSQIGEAVLFLIFYYFSAPVPLSIHLPNQLFWQFCLINVPTILWPGQVSVEWLENGLMVGIEWSVNCYIDDVWIFWWIAWKFARWALVAAWFVAFVAEQFAG